MTNTLTEEQQTLLQFALPAQAIKLQAYRKYNSARKAGNELGISFGIVFT